MPQRPHCAPPRCFTACHLHWVKRDEIFDVWVWDHHHYRWLCGVNKRPESAYVDGWRYVGPAIPPESSVMNDEQRIENAARIMAQADEKSASDWQQYAHLAKMILACVGSTFEAQKEVKSETGSTISGVGHDS